MRAADWDDVPDLFDQYRTVVDERNAAWAERDRLAAALADAERLLGTMDHFADVAQRVETRNNELAAALADRDAQVTRVRALADESRSGIVWVKDLRRALDGAGDEPRPASRQTYSPVRPGHETHGLTTCPTPPHLVEPTGDEPPTEPRDLDGRPIPKGWTCACAAGRPDWTPDHGPHATWCPSGRPL